MSIIPYDLGFLVIFTAAVFIFLYIRRKNIAREGILYLYKTQVGVKLIDYIGKKFGKQIRSLHYIVIALGFLLLAGILFLIGQTVFIYLTTPEITTIIKTPPLLPLIPYFPQLFGAQSLFPPFYFVYFLLALIVVAFSHEFSHGIFARANNVRIKSTGVAFLGPILGAFVEQDDKQMTKKGKIPQMAILGAGVFANIIMAIIFFILLVITFKLLFAPAGIIFASYSYGIINTTEITSIANATNGLLILQTTDKNYLVDQASFNNQMKDGGEFVVAYFDAPAIRNNLSGAIIQVEEARVTSLQEFVNIMENYKPGQTIKITTTTKEYSIKLDEHPENSSKAFIGIGFRNEENRKLLTKIFFFKDQNVYYQPKSDASTFIYELFWWIAMINLMVGLFNMLPFGFLDGGRFFYLTVWGITKSEDKAKKAFGIATKIILGLFALLIIAWLISFRIR